ncbi:Cys-tRNA(Pro)/Cys-tRNA(Cys) deacylase [Clostridium cavendishii DSM 21758]|uniref:Cys-tRNA(Pro)/Cys-tRNA(Cys) deacylase n=1 Tax=Clostridium cavendishii DSM 21758 TaxID=1121302 RepID=A0A1M6BC72_9CLOT|nr:Cys-tRNA(Pro) deacylase [Clostridium cavendishii]SHI46267.1 Cys-tRNA(Pro)/Cys-tRNA(Cys) deacylase [Clostridium cavendishii DSM 21758]
MSKIKTNAMRILDSNRIEYEIITYENKDGKIDGVSVANKIGRDINMVYKTLVTQGLSKEYYVFVIPVNEELDFKKAAKVASEKSIELINVKDLTKITGYIRGGCSPIGMKKLYKTFINITASEKDKIVVSGGKIGVQLEINPQELVNLLNARYEDIIKN